MKPFAPSCIKPVHTLLAVFVLLAMAIVLFLCSRQVLMEKSYHETSEGAGSFHSPLICI